MIFAPAVQSRAGTGCLLDSESETIRAIYCAPQKDGSTILTLCDEKTQCRTKKVTIVEEHPCPATSRPNQQARIIRSGDFLTINAIDFTFSAYLIAMQSPPLTSCTFLPDAQCVSWGKDVLIVTSDRKDLDMLKNYMSSKTSDFATYKFVVATEKFGKMSKTSSAEPALSTLAGAKTMALYNVDQKKWQEGAIYENPEIKDCD